MPKRKRRRWGKGARRLQPVYARDLQNKVRRRGDGSPIVLYRVWTGYDWLALEDGSRLRVCASVARGCGLGDLEEKLAARRLVAQRLQGTAKTNDTSAALPTVDALVERWLASAEVKRKSRHGSLKIDTCLWRAHVAVPCETGTEPIGSRVAAELTGEHLQELDRRTQRPRDAYRLGADGQIRPFRREALSPKRFSMVVSMLAQALDWGLATERRRWSGLTANVARGYVCDRSPNQRSRPARALLTPGQMLEAMDAALDLDPPLAALLALVALGERPNAMRSLEWSMFDEPTSTFLITGQWVVADGVRRWAPTKNKREKSLGVPSRLLRYVLACRGYSPRWVVPHGPSRPSTFMAESTCCRRWAAFKRASGLPFLAEIYAFKHSSASAAMALGFSLDQIATTMGVSRQVAAGHYVKADLELRGRVLGSVFPEESDEAGEVPTPRKP